MDLKAAVGLNVGELVAFVGAGGKTTAAWRLLRLLVDSGERAVFTTTTRIFQPKNVALILDPSPDPEEIARKLSQSSALVLAAGQGESGDPDHAARSPYPADPVKLVGLEPDVLDGLARRLPDVTWLVEADGAQGRLLKAPAEYEPVIPSGVGSVIIVAGLDAIGKPLDERVAHRAEIAARLLIIPLSAIVTPELFAGLVGHPAGGLKGIPDGAEVVVLLAQWNDCPTIYADTVARHLLSERSIRRVVLVNLRSPGAVLEIWTQHQQFPLWGS